MNDDLYQEALEEFGRRLRRGREDGLIRQPTAMTLATADDRGRPSARTVLLKDFDRHGFVFYTNRESRKGEQLAANSWAALCFYWDPYWEQAVVEGPVQEVSPVEADLYWVTRSRISQLGAWASRQSRPLSSRVHLISEVTAYETQVPGGHSPASRVLVRFPRDPPPHRVLDRTVLPPQRPATVRKDRPGLDGPTALSLIAGASPGAAPGAVSYRRRPGTASYRRRLRSSARDSFRSRSAAVSLLPREGPLATMFKSGSSVTPTGVRPRHPGVAGAKAHPLLSAAGKPPLPPERQTC